MEKKIQKIQKIIENYKSSLSTVKNEKTSLDIMTIISKLELQILKIKITYENNKFEKNN